MKKSAWVLVFLMSWLLVVSAHAQTLTLGNMDPDGSYKMTLRRVAVTTGADGLKTYHYRVQQGSCTDGTYAYLILESQTDYQVSLWKYDMSTWEAVNSVYFLPLDHGNDMTYNSRLNRLVVVHNKPNYSTISFVNPDTLEIEETRKIGFRIYAIAYNEERDQYVVGLSDGYDFAILNADFQQEARYNGLDTGLVRQGADCDERYIYFPQNNKDCTLNELIVYDWEGALVTRIRVVSYQEIESMFHVGDDVYIAFNASGSYLYKATLQEQQ